MNNNTTELTELDVHFNKLYSAYHSTKVMSYSDMLVYYGIPFGYVSQTENELNALIKSLNLPLVAKKNATNEGLFFDTICVTHQNNNK